MARTRKDEASRGGLGLAARFGLAMTVALAVVMGLFGFSLFSATQGIVDQSVEAALQASAQAMAEAEGTNIFLTGSSEGEAHPDDKSGRRFDIKFMEGKFRGSSGYLYKWDNWGDLAIPVQFVDSRNPDVVRALWSATQAMAESQKNKTYEQVGKTATVFGNGHGNRFDIEFKSGEFAGEAGHLYKFDKRGDVALPVRGQNRGQRNLIGLFLAATVTVILVGAGVAYWIARKVSMPIEGLVDDVRNISHGNLQHRTRVRGGGEVALLARSIDRMASSLEEAQDAEIELGIREREIEVAQEVREALLPEEKPTLEGYRFGDLMIGSPEPGGDFYDYVVAEGKVVLLVCDVSGQGVPGALVGATARAYLRNELGRGGELVDTLKRVNRDLARDVRRGMYVTALCASIDPEENVATVACAGHKIPLIRYSAAEKKVRVVQPEGIALGFDKGAVFDRGLAVQRVPLEPGDRLVLANTGTVRVVNPDGEELGEKAFYRMVLQTARLAPDAMIERLQAGLEEYAEDEDFPADISILILAREA